MKETPLKLECELLARTNKKLIMGAMGFYVLFFIFTRFLTPSYKKGSLIYEGLLRTWDLDECIPYAYALQIVMMVFVVGVFWRILTYSILIKGTVIITPEYIKIIRWKKYSFLFQTDKIKNLVVHFNYFKKNDVSPRNIVSGNNNIITFERYNRTFSYEFLLQTPEEDEVFREILDLWRERNISFEYHTVLSDF